MSDKWKVPQKQPSAALNTSLASASAIVTRDYLGRLEQYEIMKPSAEDIDIDVAACGKFYRLSKLVVDREENFLNKLTTVVNVASSIDCSIATVIKSDGCRIDYYFGILSKNARKPDETDGQRRLANNAAFQGALQGNLIGSELEELTEEEVKAFCGGILKKEGSCYSAVSGIVALRDREDKSAEGYVQGIENLVDSLKGLKYTVVMLADPVDTGQIQVIRQGYEMIYTQLAAYARSSVTMNESDTLTLSKTRTEGISEGISQGISMTQSTTRTKGKSHGRSANVGIDLGIEVTLGLHAGVNSSTGETAGRTATDTKSQQRNKAVADAAATAKTAGRSLQLTYENRAVKSLLDKIDRQLERLDECDSFGAFECAAYVIADERETALTVAGNYNALMRGNNSSVQASHINSWYKPEDTKRIGQYVGAMVHPRFFQSREGGVIVTPASLVSGDELAIQIGLPKKSVPGITVIPMAPFGRNVMEEPERTIALGNLCHMGHDEGAQKVKIDLESLSMHTFITGSTGKGKSTTIYSLLDQLMQHGVKFMVVEPAKGEYKHRFGGCENVSVYGTNDRKTPLLRIDPFSFPEDIHVLEHIDRLIEIFNVCWPMYAAMPAVLKDAVERAYVVSGWNLAASECRYRDLAGRPLFPSFLDVLRQINVVMDESSYSSDSRGDYKGALCTRLRSLTNGLYGQIFTNDELSGEELFDRNVIVDLSRTGSSETRSLIMGLLVMKLQEYRMAGAGQMNAPLKHITVLEEAHNILKRTSTAQSGEGFGMIGKSVEMLAGSIAEMRTYGEGFLIADQAPGLLDPSVIRNTNTKIILGLPDLEDRELVGRAAGLNDDQIVELSRLKTFVAAVYQNNWLEPVLCHIDTNFKEVSPYVYEKQDGQATDKYPFVEFLLTPLEERGKLEKEEIDRLRDGVYRLPLPAEARAAFIRYTEATKKAEVQKLRGQVAYGIFNSETAFGLAKDKEGSIGSWYECMKEILDPAITHLEEGDQRKIIALLTRQRAQLDGGAEAKRLFDRLMDFM